MLRVAAIVVTYNRLNLLKECVDALLNQTYKNMDILIIDNASTDNTFEYANELVENENNVEYYRLDNNVGGAGGFYEGIKRAASQKHDWIWLMDDDTIPEKNALEELCIAASKIKEPIGFISSNVFGISNKTMNTPRINSLKKGENGYADWNERLEDSLVKVQSATFCSIFINLKAIQSVGFPIKSYFIWGDDTEYTLRLSYYYGQGWIAGKSKVLHKRENEKSLSILTENNKNRINNYFYYVRNYLINVSLYYGYMAAIAKTLHFVINMLQIAVGRKEYKFSKISIIIKGICAFWFRKYDRQEVKNRINVQR